MRSCPSFIPIQSSTLQLWEGLMISPQSFFFFFFLQYQVIPLVFIQSHWPRVLIYKACAGRNAILASSWSMGHPALTLCPENLWHAELTLVPSFRSELIPSQRTPPFAISLRSFSTWWRTETLHESRPTRSRHSPAQIKVHAFFLMPFFTPILFYGPSCFLRP